MRILVCECFGVEKFEVLAHDVLRVLRGFRSHGFEDGLEFVECFALFGPARAFRRNRRYGFPHGNPPLIFVSFLRFSRAYPCNSAYRSGFTINITHYPTLPYESQIISHKPLDNLAIM